MHFFYLDESGDTGANLADPQQPIFVLGGVSLRDEGWNKTYADLTAIVLTYFGGNVPEGFELHGYELLSPTGEGPFAGHELQQRLELVKALIGLVVARKHHVQYIALDKSRLAAGLESLSGLPAHASAPYTLGYDYLITEIEQRVARGLGRSARGMLIIDKKDEHAASIEAITAQRRFGLPVACRTKWISEFSYPLDSIRNPMVQLSDIVILCIRRFFEVEEGYKPDAPEVVKQFYAKCFLSLYGRTPMKTLAPHKGAGNRRLNELLSTASCSPRRNVAQRYAIG